MSLKFFNCDYNLIYFIKINLDKKTDPIRTPK